MSHQNYSTLPTNLFLTSNKIRQNMVSSFFTTSFVENATSSSFSQATGFENVVTSNIVVSTTDSNIDNSSSEHRCLWILYEDVGTSKYECNV